MCTVSDKIFRMYTLISETSLTPEQQVIVTRRILNLQLYYQFGISQKDLTRLNQAEDSYSRAIYDYFIEMNGQNGVWRMWTPLFDLIQYNSLGRPQIACTEQIRKKVSGCSFNTCPFRTENIKGGCTIEVDSNNYRLPTRKPSSCFN